MNIRLEALTNHLNDLQWKVFCKTEIMCNLATLEQYIWDLGYSSDGEVIQYCRAVQMALTPFAIGLFDALIGKVEA